MARRTADQSGRRTRAARFVIVAAIFLFASSPGRAVTITDIGSNGAPGIDGEGALAVAAGAGATNFATAAGGSGGIAPSSNVAPGDGGSASASATTVNAGAATATAQARGGGGGASATPVGSGTTLPSLGGTAVASAVAESTTSASASALAVATAGGAGLARGPADGSEGVGASLGAVLARSAGGSAAAEGRVVGGRGGSAVEATSGDGGDGADVALVDAVDAETSGALSVTQIAEGGAGGGSQLGVGGDGGDASSSLSIAKSAASLLLSVEAMGGDGSGASGGATYGGDGGSATATVVSSNTAGSSAVRGIAEGGFAGAIQASGAGASAGVAGDAFASVLATSTGDGHAVELASAVATGGGGRSITFGTAPIGGSGGDARAEVVGRAFGDSAVTVNSVASGGWGSSGIDSTTGMTVSGGDAAATAEGHNAGSAPVSVAAEARGGDGGPGAPGILPGAGGTASARARGTSISGNVTVLASQIGGDAGARNAGPDVGVPSASSMIDAVSGSTAGHLRLIQESQAGVAADAFASLVAENDGGGSLAIDVTATGGVSGLSGFSVADQGGVARLGQVRGTSRTGASVDVVAAARSGSGLHTIGSSPNGGDGASAEVVDAVSGATDGLLRLTQQAFGGAAGTATDAAMPTAGAATSRLTHTASAESVELRSDATGGRGAERLAGTGPAGAGGSARSEADSTNVSGSQHVIAYAQGGVAGSGAFTGSTGFAGGAGGNADVFVQTVTHGDGHEVWVGGAVSDSGAHAGEGGLGGAGLGTSGRSGDGGAATSRSIGIALGNSVVEVGDLAFGGASPSALLGNGLIAGNGGAANSSALGIGGGDSPVFVSAYAEGGEASDDGVVVRGRNGDASATSRAEGLGRVVAHAGAVAGPGRSFGIFDPESLETAGGAAHARSSGMGTNGFANAEAITAAFELASLRTLANAEITRAASVEAWSGTQASFAHRALGAADAFATAAGLPDHASILAVTDGTARVASAFSDDALAIVLAVGQVGFTNTQAAGDAPAFSSAQVEIVANALRVSALQNVIIGFMNPVSLTPDFDALRFRADLRGQTLIDVTFDAPDAALAYFDDRVLDLGGFELDDFMRFTPLTLTFDFTGTELGSDFGVDLVVGLTPVPEPSTALQLALGVVALAARARRGARGET